MPPVTKKPKDATIIAVSAHDNAITMMYWSCLQKGIVPDMIMHFAIWDDVIERINRAIIFAQTTTELYPRTIW